MNLHNINKAGAKLRRKKRTKISKKPLDSIAIFRNNISMSMIRDAIIKRQKDLGLTTYQLAKMVEGHIPQRTVYDFISGETEASSEVASILMQALELTILPKNKRKPKLSKGPKAQKGGNHGKRQNWN